MQKSKRSTNTMMITVGNMVDSQVYRYLINIYSIEVITDYSALLYKTSNGQIGNTAHMLKKSGPFGRTAGFSKHLAGAGNYVNNGLNTICDRERYIDQSKDWMAKNS